MPLSPGTKLGQYEVITGSHFYPGGPSRLVQIEHDFGLEVGI